MFIFQHRGTRKGSPSVFRCADDELWVDEEGSGCSADATASSEPDTVRGKFWSTIDDFYQNATLRLSILKIKMFIYQHRGAIKSL